MVDLELLKIICCPSCNSDLVLVKENLVCSSCNKSFIIKNDIPVLLEGHGFTN